MTRIIIPSISAKLIFCFSEISIKYFIYYAILEFIPLKTSFISYLLKNDDIRRRRKVLI